MDKEEPNIDSLINQLPKLKLDTNKVNLLIEITDKYNRYSEDTIDIIKYADQALELSKQINWIEGEVKSLSNLGNLYYHLNKDYYKSIEYFQRFLKINKELGNKFRVYGGFACIGRAYERLYNYTKAIEYYKLGLEKAEKICNDIKQSSPLLIPLHDLYSAYEKAGKYEEAFEIYKKYDKLKDSIQESEYETEIDTLKLKIENELREKEIDLINKDKEIEKMMSYMMYGGISGLVLIIALAIFLIFALKRV